MITILGNVLVLLAFCMKHSLRNIRSNTFIASLGKFNFQLTRIPIVFPIFSAITDLLVGVLVMPFSIQYHNYNYHWVASNVSCYFWTFADMVSSAASIWSLVAIAIDRWMVSLPNLLTSLAFCYFIFLGSLSTCNLHATWKNV